MVNELVVHDLEGHGAGPRGPTASAPLPPARRRRSAPPRRLPARSTPREGDQGRLVAQLAATCPPPASSAVIRPFATPSVMSRTTYPRCAPPARPASACRGRDGWGTGPRGSPRGRGGRRRTSGGTGPTSGRKPACSRCPPARGDAHRGCSWKGGETGANLRLESHRRQRARHPEPSVIPRPFRHPASAARGPSPPVSHHRGEGPCVFDARLLDLGEPRVDMRTPSLPRRARPEPPRLSQSPSTVSPGVSTAESSAFGLRRLPHAGPASAPRARGWCPRPGPRRAGTRPSLANRATEAAGAGRRSSPAAGPGRPPSSRIPPSAPGWPPAPAPPQLDRSGPRGRPRWSGTAGLGSSRPHPGHGWRCSGPVRHTPRHSVCRTRSSPLLRTVVDQRPPAPRWVALQAVECPVGDHGGIGGRRRGRGQVGCQGDSAGGLRCPARGDRDTSLRTLK